jgi:Transposase DDE domain
MAAMLLGSIFDRFVTYSPLSVMARGLLEHALVPKELDALFERTAERQYTRELLFSTTVDLMSLVVTGIRPTVHAGFQALKDRIPVSVTSVYNKLDGIEPLLSAELVRHTTAKLEPIIRQLDGQRTELLAGYRTLILDGNHLAATEHRLKELHATSAGPLPGLCLVVLDPALMLAVDVFPCEDGHAQERSLLPLVLQTVQPRDVWIDDRNFCTLDFLFGIWKRDGCFVTRQHKNLPWQEVTPLKHVGTVEGAEVWEQRIRLENAAGEILFCRRIKLVLAKATRDGEWELFILTNVPQEAADGLCVARLYRQRWTIEIMFRELAEMFENEIDTLAYPKAALFGFCTGLAAYNVLSAVKAALRSVHGEEKIEKELSGYYVADEIAGTYRGMMIAIPAEEWLVFGTLTVEGWGTVLRELASRVQLEKFRKHPRGPKKPRTKRQSDRRKPHVSTAKLLAERKKKRE